MKLLQYLVLWATLFVITTFAVPLGNSSAVRLMEVATAATDISARPFIWSALGDSWASGVSYGLLGSTDYDGNKDHCLLVKHAYSVQMHTDDSWIPDGRSQAFYFQACSGTQLRMIDQDMFQNHVQLDDIQPNTDMITLQFGGNNANFGMVATTCIYAPMGLDWGPHYPDPAGRCYQEIERASAYIYSRAGNGLFEETRHVVNRVFWHKHTNANPNFRLFVLGYWEFFYDEGGDGDWCDRVSFALNVDLNARPHLTLALRKKINELIRALNAAIREGVEASLFSTRAKFLYTDKEDVTNSRFCMPGHNIYDQYFGTKVQLWNMSPQGLVLDNGGTGGADNSNGTYDIRDPTPAEFDKWMETGMFTDDPREVPFNSSQVAAALVGRVDGAATAWDPDWLDFTGPYQGASPGVLLRPFHPKSGGHTGIAQSVINQIKRDYKYRNGVNTHSIQIMFATHKGQFAWFAYQGPQGMKVNPCTPHADGFVTRVFYQKDNRADLTIEAPPYIVAENWSFSIGARGDCSFKPEAGGPGHVECQDGYLLDFQKDASWDDGVFMCDGWSGNSYRWHRAWTAEWYDKPEES